MFSSTAAMPRKKKEVTKPKATCPVMEVPDTIDLRFGDDSEIGDEIADGLIRGDVNWENGSAE